MVSSKNLPVKGLCGRCLSEFKSGDMYSRSCWYFRTSFVNCCPSNLLSGSTLPPSPFPCVNKYHILYILYIIQVCKGGYGVLGLRQINTGRKVNLQVFFLDDDILHCILWVLSFYDSTFYDSCKSLTVYSMPSAPPFSVAAGGSSSNLWTCSGEVSNPQVAHTRSLINYV